MATKVEKADTSLLKEAVLLGKPLCFYDTETTGLEGTSEVIQFSGQMVKADTWETIKEESFYINIGKPIPPVITELTGITDEIIAREGISKEEAYHRIKEFFGDNVVSGYNITFDIKRTDNLFKEFGDTFKPQFKSDVYKIVKQVCQKGETENQKLGTMLHYFGADEGLTFHNAMDDVTATIRLAKKLYELRINPDPFEVAKFDAEKKEKKSESKSHTYMPYLPEAPAKKDYASPIKVNRISRWKQSKTMDRTYIQFYFQNSSGSGQIYFDNYHHKFCDAKDSDLMSSIDMYGLFVQSVDILLMNGLCSFSDVCDPISRK